MHKFYVCEFTNIKYPMPDSDKVFVKFGITHHWDVMDRFNPKVDDGYTKNYSDWKIVCKFSKPCSTKEQVENYLKISDNNLYYDNTGITELRLLTAKQAKWVYYTLHSTKKETI